MYIKQANGQKIDITMSTIVEAIQRELDSVNIRSEENTEGLLTRLIEKAQDDCDDIGIPGNVPEKKLELLRSAAKLYLSIN